MLRRPAIIRRHRGGGACIRVLTWILAVGVEHSYVVGVLIALAFVGFEPALHLLADKE